MYDLSFIFDELGFADLPAEIERERLFNVSFDLHSGSVKLYILDSSERFLYKVSTSGITRQYSGDDPEHGGSSERLDQHLGCRFNPREIVVDAVEDDIYYIYLDDAGLQQSLQFFAAVCRTYHIDQVQLLRSINAIGNRSYPSVSAAASEKAVSLVKIPFTSPDVKIYARPFLNGGGFDINDRARLFLKRLYACDDSALAGHLSHAWVATELTRRRMLIVTQYHALLHRD